VTSQYKCEQPCVAFKTAICARLTGCSGRFLACLSDCFDYEAVWKEKGESYAKKNRLRTKSAHCEKCSLHDMTSEKIEVQRKRVLKRTIDAITFLNEIKKRKEMRKLQEGRVEIAEK
jgi:hypothetical protein